MVYFHTLNFHTMPGNFNLSCVDRKMSILSGITLFCLFLPLYNCYRVEISLNNNNDSNSLRLLCGHRTENLELERNHRILWQGSRFGYDEHQKLSEMLPADAFVPNVSINSSESMECYLIARKGSSYNLNSHRKRVLREGVSLASIPAENGVCPPGYRINANRCFACFPGSYTSGQDTECFLCPKDFYVRERGADSCLPCPDGKKTLAQGADSVESCLYFDESGHPIKPETLPWIPIYSLIGVIILFVWIVIIFLLVRCYKGRQKDDADQAERADKKAKEDSRSRKPLLRKKSAGDEAVYESSSDSASHIYEDLGDYDDRYEIPIKPTEPPIYVDFDAPKPPPKRRQSIKDGQKSDSAIYEIPIKKPSTERRAVPTKTISEDQQEGTKDEDLYEVPNPKDSEHLYDDIKDAEDMNDDVQPPTHADFDAPKPRPKRRVSPTLSHFQDRRESDSDMYEVPIKKPSKERRAVPTKTISEDQQEVTKDEDLYEVPEPNEHPYDAIEEADDMYDDAQYMSDEEEYEIGRKSKSAPSLSKTHSTGFKPGTSSTEGFKKASAERIGETRKRSSEERKSKKTSDERLTNIPEETENIYDISPSDSS